MIVISIIMIIIMTTITAIIIIAITTVITATIRRPTAVSTRSSRGVLRC
jgi:hypothetical protein